MVKRYPLLNTHSTRSQEQYKSATWPKIISSGMMDNMEFNTLSARCSNRIFEMVACEAAIFVVGGILNLLVSTNTGIHACFILGFEVKRSYILEFNS